MIHRQRKATPLIALLAFELAAIMALQAMGSAQALQVPWDNLSTWLSTATIDQLAPPFIRVFALVIAYWMLASTALCIVAYLSRIPSIIRLSSVFAIPSVRRIVDAALVVSIATSSITSFAGPVFANGGITSTIDDEYLGEGDVTVGAPATPLEDELSVATPTVGGSETTTTEPDVTTTPVTEAPSGPTTETGTTTEDIQTNPIAVSTPQPLGPDVTASANNSGAGNSSPSPTTAPPSSGTNTSSSSTNNSSSSNSNDYYNGNGGTTSTTIAAKAGNSTNAGTINSGGVSTSTPTVPQTSSTGTEVLGAQEHRVVSGDNLWTIARDALASANNTSPSSLSEDQIRDYWMKVIDANRDNLRSGDPHWIFPDEVVQLPSL